MEGVEGMEVVEAICWVNFYKGKYKPNPPQPCTTATRISKFPDLEFVQVVAYHRLVTFRKLLDEVLGGKNRFWNVHRKPPFAIKFIDFQLAEGRGREQPAL